MPKKNAQHEIEWTLEIETTSRNQLIDVSAFLAQAIRPDFFHNPINIPLIIVPNVEDRRNGGKCLVVEAMMKSILDGYDPENMKRPDAPRSMFIEKNGADATRQYCKAFGTVAGTPVMLGFDRTTRTWYDYERQGQAHVIQAFRQADEYQQFDSPGPVGAIFRSGVSLNSTEPWLVIYMHTRRDWKRELKIEVREDKFKECPRFREYWKALQNFAITGELIDPRTSPLDGVAHAFRGAAIHINHDYLITKTDPEATLLKFAFENGTALGISEGSVISAASAISGHGDVERTKNFLVWLNERGETDIVKKIITDSCVETNLGYVFKGDYPVAFDDILPSVANLRSTIQKMIKQNRYALVHELIDEGRFDLVERVVDLAKEHLTDGGVRKLLRQSYVTKPVRLSILERLKEAGQEDLIRKIHKELEREKHPRAREAIEAFDGDLVCTAIVPIEFYRKIESRLGISELTADHQ